MDLAVNTADTGRAPITVRVTLAVTVDPVAWARAAGVMVDAAGNFTVSDVRDDVRRYMLNAVQNSAMLEDADGSARLITTGPPGENT